MKTMKSLAALAAFGCAAISTPAAAQDQPYIGTIQQFGFNFCPRNWMPTDGRLLAVNQYSALFSLLGTTYGGNGQTSFGLPDLRGRMAIAPGQGPGQPTYVLGQMGGNSQTTLLLPNLPAHTHTARLRAEDTNGTQNTPTNGLMSDFPVGSNVYADGPANVNMHPDAIQVSPTGNNQPFNNMPPYLAVTTCIATSGIFPPRP